MSFVFDIESDELADALRSAFPEYRTLRERKHAAVIKLFEQELREMQLNTTNTMGAQKPRDYDSVRSATRVDSCNGGHLSGSSAPPASPASSLNSTVDQDPGRRFAAVQTASSLSLPADPTLARSSTHLVFNAFDGRIMQQKTKRKMTSEERQEYRRTRQRGACAKCKRQKGKCTHIDDARSTLVDAISLTENFKRLGTDSKGPRSNRLNHDKSSLNTYKRDLDTIEQAAVASQQPSRRSSSATNCSLTTPDQAQWPIAADTQLHTSGYVQSSSSYQHRHGSFSDYVSPYWSGYNSMDMDPFQPESGNQGHGPFPESPSIYVHRPDSEASFASAYQPFTQWSQDHPEDTGQT
ncbi:hypothetical protein E8E11_009567 [Didymella keratinophila]|nr:hypothetical protein E8E11_009567 [Didymella keratinophila]